MSHRFRVSVTIDEGKRRIIFNMIGTLDSAALIDQWIEIYEKLEAPWRYDRLFDYRRSEGVIAYEEIRRLADWWNQRYPTPEHKARIAVVVNNPFDQARVSVVSQLFPNEIRRSFTRLDEALDWLNSSENERTTRPTPA